MLPLGLQALLCLALGLLCFVLPLLPTSRAIDRSCHTLVDQKQGVDNESCWSARDQPCRTLDQALKLAAETTNRSNVSICLLPGDYNITTAYSFVGKDIFELTVHRADEEELGSGDERRDEYGATILCVGSDVGIAILNSSNILFENVTFVGCGAVRNSTSRDYDGDEFLRFRVTLYLLFCSSVVMDNVIITQTNGTGLVLYSTVGENRFTRCNFTANAPSENSTLGGGGGVNVEFLYCVPGNTDCFKNSFNSSSDYSSNASYLFDNCYFSDNIAKTDNFIGDSFVIPAGGYSVALGRGGGLSLFFKGFAKNIDVTIERSYFTNNVATWGGGMDALFEDSSSSNSVRIYNSSFMNNSCAYRPFSYQGTGGGGARIHFAGLNQVVKYNSVVLVDTIFHGNHAYFGGGVSFYTTREIGVRKSTNTINFTNCRWTGNTARLGSAIDLTLWHEITEGEAVRPQLTNCSFENNTVHYTDLIGAPAGIGTIYTDSVDMVFEDTLDIMNNDGAGIAGLDAGLEFIPETNARFESNIGRNGGAIALFGYSFIRVYNNTLLEFTNNTAQFKGGAIYWESVGDHELISSRNCFIRYYNVSVDPMNWQTQFVFNNNSAALSGNAIYATTLLTCLWGGNPYGNLLNTLLDQYDRVFCWNNHSLIWDYGADNCSNSIATAGAYFTNVTEGSGHSYTMSMLPGNFTRLPVSMSDDRNKSLPPNAQIFSVELDKEVFYLTDAKLKLTPPPDLHKVKMKISTIQPRVLTTEVIVEFEPCPPGYYLNYSIFSCDFANYPYIETDGPFASKIQRGYWIGYSGMSNGTDNGTLVSGECIYCGSDPNLVAQGEYIKLPNKPNETDMTLCYPLNRTGFLCSKCRDGFGPAVNSKYLQCVNCTDGVERYTWVFYILTEFVPITILLVFIVMFNISVTSGPGNAFIFFAQIISSTFGVHGDGIFNYQSVTNASSTITQVYTSLYDIWNLNFFDSVQGWQYCLSPHLNALQLRALDYLSAAYPLMVLSIILVIVVLHDRENKVVLWTMKPLHFLFARFRRRWNFKRSIVDAFGTFLVLSFTKFAIISAYLTYPGAVYDENGTVTDLRCYVYGEYRYFSKEYAPYLVVSIIVFFTVCILIPLLLFLYSLKPFYSCLTQLRLKFLLPGPKSQLFLNVFYNCYKDGTEGTYDLRFFASLYFGLRVLMVLIYPIAPTWALQYLLQQVVCTVGILLFAALQPYKIRFYNFLDATAFSLLAVINVITFYNRYLAAVGNLPSPPMYWIQTILIFLPLVYISSYLIVYFCQANKVTLKWLIWCICCCRRKKATLGLLSSDRFEQSFGSFMDSMVAAGRWRSTINYYGPVAPTEPEEHDVTPAGTDFHTSIRLLEPHKDDTSDEDTEPLFLQTSDQGTAGHGYGSVPSTHDDQPTHNNSS